MEQSRNTLARYAPHALLIIVFGIACWIVGGHLITKYFDLAYPAEPFQTAAGDACSVAVIPLTGQVFASAMDEQQTVAGGGSASSAETILKQIQRAEADPSISGIVLRIDSPGGSPAAGERIAEALKNSSKPTAAYVWDIADSAAYLAGTGADAIVASPFSEVADIGVTSSYLDQSQKNSQEGLTFIQLSAGKYKDIGNPDKPLSSEEKALLQAEVNHMYLTFVNEVAQNRSLSTSTVTELANGAGILAEDAKAHRLIDIVGGEGELKSWFEKKLGEKGVALCQPL